MGGSCGIRRTTRRLIVFTGGVLLASAFLSGPALAQLPLASSSGAENTLGSTVATITQALPAGQLAAQAAPVVEQVAQPVARSTEPVAQIASPVAQAAAPVVRAATPVVEQAVAPVVEAAEPVLAPTTALVADAAAPALAATASLLETTAPLLESTTLAAAVGGGSSATGRTSPDPGGTGTANASERVDLQAVSTDPAGTRMPADPVADLPAVAALDDRGAARARSAGESVPTLGDSPSVTWTSSGAAPRAVRATHDVKAAAPRLPAPTEPNGPLGFLAAISAALGSSAALIFFAALAAVIVLAVPGLGRRLRPVMAPWPLPIPLASLERPG